MGRLTARATHSVRILVSRLRAVLEPGGPRWRVLTTVAGGYVLADVTAQLPAATADFVGRGELVAGLSAALLDDSAPTLLISAVSGIGGAGGTALAIHIGHRDEVTDSERATAVAAIEAGYAGHPPVASLPDLQAVDVDAVAGEPLSHRPRHRGALSRAQGAAFSTSAVSIQMTEASPTGDDVSRSPHESGP
ncbi:hypothetical protein AB0I28_14075 [Phytomonospora sp. NPDC050363]|uniref:hypothetical protein n=1 Tax=Phytomonospora sp. NPDC050363 TaxID=3155642 RepID=UPI0033D44537